MSQNISYRFGKDEKLCSHNKIDALFSRTDKTMPSAFSYPIKVAFMARSEGVTQVLFSVPKRAFKHAVDRNLLKRRLREAYRLNKSLISAHQLDIVFIFIGKEIVDYQAIEKGMKSILKKIAELDSDKKTNS